ncbi:MAG: hypothetical protein WCE58_05215, partial [Gallionella sp.]
FEITTPKQLLEKATHDIERLKGNHLDAYAAFDFFVTARHIPNWVYPNDSAKCDALFAQYVELRVCRHLGDGAKHFIATDRRHKQVRSTVRTHNAWGNSWDKSWGNSWGTDELIIRLDPADRDTSQLGAQIRALDLAERILAILKQVVP